MTNLSQISDWTHLFLKVKQDSRNKKKRDKVRGCGIDDYSYSILLAAYALPIAENKKHSTQFSVSSMKMSHAAELTAMDKGNAWCGNLLILLRNMATNGCIWEWKGTNNSGTANTSIQDLFDGTHTKKKRSNCPGHTEKGEAGSTVEGSAQICTKRSNIRHQYWEKQSLACRST